MQDDERRRSQARALRETAGVRRLHDQSVLQVGGEDVREWLNGQITNDVAHSERGQAVYALVLTLKGKIMTDLWALDRGEDFWLVLPAAKLDPIAEHFDRFIIMEDVELQPLHDQVVITVQGPKAPEVVQEQTAWPCDRLGAEGRDVVVPRSEADDVEAQLVRAAEAVGGGEIDEDGWELARLRLGRGRVGIDFGDWTLPQEAALKHAIAFGKGCYQGQEPVVMLEHRGKPPKHLVHLTIETDHPPEPGAELVDDDGKRLGRITSAVADPDTPGRVAALGYVKKGHAEPGAALHAGERRATVREVLTS